MTADAAEQVAQRLKQGVSDAYRRYTADRQSEREDLYALTMSGLGGCSRQAAYRIARTPPSEDLVFTEMREANLGTMIHLGVLPPLAELLDGVEELPVTLTAHGLTVKGRADLYSRALNAVVDLKTVGLSKFSALGDDISPSHWMQIAGYALAVAQSGQRVDWLAWIYLDRSGGAEHVVVEPFDDIAIKQVEDRLAELAAYAEQPDAAPRGQRGPGLSYVCDGCPWLRTCWGQDAEPGVASVQRVLVHDNAGVARALQLYSDARKREVEACDDKDFARAMFSSYDPGQYGGWQFGWSNPSTTNDKDAAVDLLKQAGIPVPQKTTARRLIVKRARTSADDQMTER